MRQEVKRARRRGFTRVSRKHQVTIPTEALALSGVTVGDRLKVEVRGREIVLTPDVDVLDRYDGIFDGVYPPGYLDELRDEWR